MRRGALLLMLTLVVSGCMPQVLHGPRIDDGTSGVINVGFGRNFSIHEPDDPVDDIEFIVPSLNFGLRQGFVGGDGKSAVSIGLQSSAFGIAAVGDDESGAVLGATSYADVYVQPKHYVEGRSDFGIGLMASTHVAAPYFQYGRSTSNGNSWHTTQGIMMTYRQDETGDNGLQMWMTGFSWRDLSRTGRSAVTINGDALIGRVDNRTELLVTISVTAELGLSGIR